MYKTHPFHIRTFVIGFMYIDRFLNTSLLCSLRIAIFIYLMFRLNFYPFSKFVCEGLFRIRLQSFVYISTIYINQESLYGSYTILSNYYCFLNYRIDKIHRPVKYVRYTMNTGIVRVLVPSTFCRVRFLRTLPCLVTEVVF